MLINELRKGQKGRIVRVFSDSVHNRRLCEMGFVKGTEIEITYVAPMGYPIAIRVRGYQVILSELDIKSIEIEAI